MIKSHLFCGPAHSRQEVSLCSAAEPLLSASRALSARSAVLSEAVPSSEAARTAGKLCLAGDARACAWEHSTQMHAHACMYAQNEFMYSLHFCCRAVMPHQVKHKTSYPKLALKRLNYRDPHRNKEQSASHTKCLRNTCTRKPPAARAPKTPSLNRGAFCRTLVAPTRVESLPSACPLLKSLVDEPGAPPMLQAEKHLMFARPRKCINREAWTVWYCSSARNTQKLQQYLKLVVLFRDSFESIQSWNGH